MKLSYISILIQQFYENDKASFFIQRALVVDEVPLCILHLKSSWSLMTPVFRLEQENKQIIYFCIQSSLHAKENISGETMEKSHCETI